MAIPKFEEFFLPMLEIFADGMEHTKDDVEDAIIRKMQLTDEDKNEMTAGGTTTRLIDRVQWAITYFNQAKLIERVDRGVYKISDRGRSLFDEHPEKITRNFLIEKYPEFAEFALIRKRNSVKRDDVVNTSLSLEDMTPDEQIKTVYDELERKVAYELLENARELGPFAFEKLVMDVLSRLGYGAEVDGSVIVTKKTNDEGVDGIINQDELGLDKIYVQAKRYKQGNNIGRPAMQAFVGALAGKANKGIFITTSDFGKEAIQYIESVSKDYSVIPINGDRLAKIMLDKHIGVQVEKTYEMKKVDKDYFEQF